MTVSEASRAQIDAANPSGSTWLVANAGSGKTRVLTDRVAWLLLQGARPEGILCLTFTKAAASEMQNRLFRRLGDWAMLEENALRQQLRELGIEDANLSSQALARARTLFARAIETPGGLKIQTIHSYCASILRRFPLEARVSPAFVEIEEREQVLLASDVLDEIADGPEAHRVAAVACYLSGNDMQDFLNAVLHDRSAFETPRTRAEICKACGIPENLTADAILAQTFFGGERDLAMQAHGALNPANGQQKKAVALFSVFPWDAPTLRDLAALEAAVLSGADAKAPDTPRGSMFFNAVKAALGDNLQAWRDFLDRVAAACQLRRGFNLVERSVALEEFASLWLETYEAAKSARGWLDFDDLIEKAKALLSDAALAPWVLYRLDGGIDHLLVDEAQDTSPQQWEIIKALADEMSSGDGARSNQERSLFVVGDQKQSIYSFQGADPDGFARMGEFFETRLRDAERPLLRHQLSFSFRSSPTILKFVDGVIQGSRKAGLGQDILHRAFHTEMAGRVDIWPLIEKPDTPDETVPWYNAQDLPLPSDPKVQTAKRVASWVQEILAKPPLIDTPKGVRPLQAGDILILLRKRDRVLFPRLIKELKIRDLPILGADKFSVTDHIAVRDLQALLQFLTTPEDDLSLATVLRSPIFGWSEDALFGLAHGRNGFLWEALRTNGGPEAETLQKLNRRAEFERPFELLQLALLNFGMRRKLMGRLGAEAEDAIDALLDQALAYERQSTPSVTGFLDWLGRADLSVKRDPGGKANLIRVMTIHGAKGLEAPLVILPDAGVSRLRTNTINFLTQPDQPVLWLPAKEERPQHLTPAVAGLRAAELEEENRLLYVALTRAANWLVIGAAGEPGPSIDPEKCWYGALYQTAKAQGAQDLAIFGETGLRLQNGDWRQGAAGETIAETGVVLPDWIDERAKPGQRAEPVLHPSELGGAKALPGDAGEHDTKAALRRGRQIHLLLEHLPTLPPEDWPARAPDILALESPEQLSPESMDALLAEATAVLHAPELQPLFAEDTLAEVALTAMSPRLGARVEGQIDRLIISDDHVLAVDFKTNWVVPETPDQVPLGLLRQMGAYADILGQIYPDRRIETAILWTKTARLMTLPAPLITNAFEPG